MTRAFLIMVMITFFVPAMFAQTQPDPCSGEKMKEFEFWVGDWDLEWKSAEGKVQKGSNKIAWILGDCVLREEFDGGRDLPLRGQSYSMYDKLSGSWKQTWVDNQGSYLDFSGGVEDGRMILSRSFTNRAGKTIMQRMVFFNIARNSLEWNWENSADGGKSWNLAWHIKYTRRPE